MWAILLIVDDICKNPTECKLLLQGQRKHTQSKIPKEQVGSKVFIKKATSTLKVLQKYYKVPKFVTSVSMKVCPREFSTDQKDEVLKLKGILQQKSSSLKCRSPEEEKSDFHYEFDYLHHKIKTSKEDTLVRVPRNIRTKRSIPCDHINPSHTVDEERVRDSLATSTIPLADICVKQEGPCINRGEVDPSTNTINMCHSCKFYVYLPAQ